MDDLELGKQSKITVAQIGSDIPQPFILDQRQRSASKLSYPKKHQLGHLRPTLSQPDRIYSKHRDSASDDSDISILGREAPTSDDPVVQRGGALPHGGDDRRSENEINHLRDQEQQQNMGMGHRSQTMAKLPSHSVPRNFLDDSSD